MFFGLLSSMVLEQDRTEKKKSRQRQKSSHEPYVFMKVSILGMYFFRNILAVTRHAYV
jgi:hypothetical protein